MREHLHALLGEKMFPLTGEHSWTREKTRREHDAAETPPGIGENTHRQARTLAVKREHSQEDKK